MKKTREAEIKKQWDSFRNGRIEVSYRNGERYLGAEVKAVFSDKPFDDLVIHVSRSQISPVYYSPMSQEPRPLAPAELSWAAQCAMDIEHSRLTAHAMEIAVEIAETFNGKVFVYEVKRLKKTEIVLGNSSVQVLASYHTFSEPISPANIKKIGLYTAKEVSNEHTKG